MNEQLFCEQWNNPPKPFNSDYREYTSRLLRAVIDRMESEGLYDTMPIEERIIVFKDYHTEMKLQYELEYQKSLCSM